MMDGGTRALPHGAESNNPATIMTITAHVSWLRPSQHTQQGHDDTQHIQQSIANGMVTTVASLTLPFYHKDNQLQCG